MNNKLIRKLTNSSFQFVIYLTIIIILGNYIFTKSPLSKYILNHSVDLKLELLSGNRSPDIYVFGSSITERGISADILSQDLSKSNRNIIDVFNFSLASGSLLEQSYLLETLINNNKKPKSIIINYTAGGDFIDSKDKSIYYASMYVYDKSISYKEIFNLYADYSMDLNQVVDLFLAKTFKFYLYRKDIKKLINGYLKSVLKNRQFKPREVTLFGKYYLCNMNGDVSGYKVSPLVKFDKHYLNAIKSSDRYSKNRVDFNGMRGMNRMVEVANKENIRVYLTYVPGRMDFSLGYKYNEKIESNILQTKNNAKNYAQLMNINIIDPTKGLRFSPLNTTDTFHLNSYTSKRISKVIAENILLFEEYKSEEKMNGKLVDLGEKSLTWMDKYTILHEMNFKGKQYTNTSALFLLFDENDYVFNEALKNLSINLSGTNIELLVDLVLKKYNKDNGTASVRYNKILNVLSKITISDLQKKKLIGTLKVSIPKMKNFRRINASIHVLESFSDNEYSTELIRYLINKTIVNGRVNKDWSSFLYAYQTLLEKNYYKKYLQKHEMKALKIFAESLVNK